MIGKVRVAIFVFLLAVAGMPAQAGQIDTGDVQKQGTDIVTGTPVSAGRSVVSGEDVPLGTLHYNSNANQHQAGGNSDGMMTEVFGGTGASSTVQVPEPGTIILGGLGLLMLLISGGARGFGRK